MKQKKGRYLTVGLAGVLFLWGLCSCGLRQQTDYFAYQNRDVSATVRGMFCRMDSDGYEPSETDFCEGISSTGQPWKFAATVSMMQSTAAEGGPSVTVTFSEPPALNGVTACRKDGVVTVTLGDATVSDAAAKGIYDELLRAIDVLLLQTEITSVLSKGDGMTEVNVKTDTSHGTFFFSDSTSGALPKQISWNDEGWSLDMYLDEVT